MTPATGDALVLLTNGDSGGRLFLHVECYWDREFGAGVLQADCVEMLGEIRHTQSLIRLATWLTALACLAVLTAIIYRWRSRAFAVGLPAGFGPRLGAICLLWLLPILWSMLVHTPLGVHLFYKLPLTRAIDTLPPGSEALSWTLMALCLCVAALLLWRRAPKRVA